MIRDLRSILDGWDYEPGKISVRKIIGRDGRERIQTRIDMGVLQLETVGRPDGRRPHGHESLLDYHGKRLAEHIERYGDDNDFVLSPDECRELRNEAHMYYQRYLSLFVLEDFEGVERDTARNLRLIDCCEAYAASDADRRALTAQRAYVLMMNIRAQVYGALQQQRFEAAVALVESGIARVRNLPPPPSAGDPEPIDPYQGELAVLIDLQREVYRRLPEDSATRLRWELNGALAAEDYERAARLRDELSRRRAN